MRYFFVLAGLLFYLYPVAAQHKVVIVIENVKEIKGSIRMAVYSSEETFMKKSIASKSVNVNTKTVSIIFEDIKPGEYAISTYHDVNGNAKLDSNFMGIPKEPYGFSNNARGMFGPPSYTNAKFKISGDTNISIKVE
jgi:uncharacterized protein (DUF2141 family)